MCHNRGANFINTECLKLICYMTIASQHIYIYTVYLPLKKLYVNEVCLLAYFCQHHHCPHSLRPEPWQAISKYLLNKYSVIGLYPGIA